MKIQKLIGLLKEHLTQNGNVDVHVYNRDGDIQPITGSDTLFSTRGETEIGRFYLFSQPDAE